VLPGPHHLAAIEKIEARITSPSDPALLTAYTEFVRRITGLQDALVTRFVPDDDDEPGTHVEGHMLALDLDDFTAPSSQDDVRRWLCDVHSTVWHEIGHLEHSDCLTT
jgi:hypothetical protein